jgi:acyl carrier protein
MAVLHDSVMSEPTAERRPAPTGPVDFADILDWFLARLPDTGVDLARLDPTTRLAELGFDSLRILELKVELERDLKITIPIADLYAFTDIQGLADYLRAETARASGEPIPRVEPPAPKETPPRAQNRLAAQRQRRVSTTGASAP